MDKRHTASPTRSQENGLHSLLVFFICCGIVKTAFALMAGSPSLLVFGLIDLFGIFYSMVLLIRTEPAGSRTSRPRRGIPTGKLELFIVAGISVLLVISAVALLVSTLHVTFFHTLYPPDLTAAWIALLLGAANAGFLLYFKEQVSSIEKPDRTRIRFLLRTGLVLSVVIAASVVVSRCGFFVVDFLVAILESIGVAGYSLLYLTVSLKGLLDVVCDRETLAKIVSSLRAVDADLDIDVLRATHAGSQLDVHAILALEKHVTRDEAKGLTSRLTEALRSGLPIPHTLHVGFRAKEEE